MTLRSVSLPSNVTPTNTQLPLHLLAWSACSSICKACFLFGKTHGVKQYVDDQSAVLQPEVSDDEEVEEEADDMWHIPSPAASFKHRSTSPGSGALAGCSRLFVIGCRSLLSKQGVRFSLLDAKRQCRLIPADEMDVTAGNVSPWHAAKPAVVPLGDVCDAAAGIDDVADYSPMSDDAGGSISPQSDGGGAFFAAPPPLVYEPAFMVPWGQGALHWPPDTAAHCNRSLRTWPRRSALHQGLVE